MKDSLSIPEKNRPEYREISLCGEDFDDCQ
jgi:hypothetical protein